jgi:PAS domain S-box-containing protein
MTTTAPFTRLVEVLLIDDDHDDYLLTADMLEAIGRFSLNWAEDYDSGLEQILRHEHDVYIVDVRLAGRSGIDLIAEAVSKGSRKPMVALTGSRNPDTDQAAMEAGAVDYLIKGEVTVETLERTLRYAVERHETAIRIAESEELFRLAFEDAPIGTVLSTLDGKLVQVNNAFAEMLGYTPGQLAGKSFSEITFPEDMAASETAFGQLRRGEIPAVHLTKSYLNNHGKAIPVELKASLARSPDGQPLCVVTHIVDVTQLREANRRLEKLLASQTDLIASVSHELRTPLTSLVGFAEVLQDANTDMSSAERLEILKVIADQGSDLANLIDDLLVAARSEIGELTVSSVPVDLRAQAAQVIESMTRSTPKPIVLEGGAKAIGDPKRIRQILRNLISNAVQYGGSNITITAHPEGDWSHIAVADDGDTIPVEMTGTIFEPYVRAHERHGLTQSVGLGLAISRQLAELMNGQLTYQRKSDLNVFELQLPA